MDRFFPHLTLCAVAAHALVVTVAQPALASPRAEIVWVDPVADIAPDIAYADAPISNILFVNRCPDGCVITPGKNDARADTSSIISDSRSLSAFAHGDEVFDATIECLRDVYLPYNVQIVTTDPGDVPHHEAILAGTPTEFGFPANVGGLAPATCEPLDNVMSFTFANSLGAGVVDLCWTVAQESAHAFGLPNHVRDCSDPMTYIPGCGTKYFRDVGLQCGDFGPEECRCIGGSIQNSHRTLLEVFGPGEPVPAPIVAIQRPAAEASVSENVPVQFTVEDARAADHVYMYINGTLYQDREAWPYDQQDAPYLFEAPELPDGYMNIEIVARNELGSEGRTSIRVLKGEPCSSDGQCLEDQTCVEGGCAYPAADRALGDACDESRQCLTGLCPEKGGNKLCSEFCNPADPFSCAIGFECLSVQETGICWPEDAVDSGGCCQVSGTGPTPPLSVVVLAGLVVLLTARRRRRRESV